MNSQRSQPPSDSQLLQFLLDQLSNCLPPSWRSEVSSSAPAKPRLTLISPRGRKVTFLITTASAVYTREVLGIIDEVRAILVPGGPELLILARYLPSSTRQKLTELDVSYADATGNVLIAADGEEVTLSLYTAGANKDPWRTPEGKLRSLQGRPAAKVVRSLIDYSPPVGVRELSQRSSSSLGSTARVVDFLDKAALITRNGGGRIVDIDWPALLLAWTESYGFQRSNEIVAGFEPRGIDRVLENLRSVPEGFAISGSLAARRVAEVAESRLIMMFSENPAETARALGLRETDSPNVLIARPMDPALLNGTTQDPKLKLPFVSYSQAAADLLSSPGRGPAEAEALIEWMKGNEDAWRYGPSS